MTGLRLEWGLSKILINAPHSEEVGLGYGY